MSASESFQLASTAPLNHDNDNDNDNDHELEFMLGAQHPQPQMAAAAAATARGLASRAPRLHAHVHAAAGGVAPAFAHDEGPLASCAAEVERDPRRNGGRRLVARDDLDAGATVLVTQRALVWYGNPSRLCAGCLGWLPLASPAAGGTCGSAGCDVAAAAFRPWEVLCGDFGRLRAVLADGSGGGGTGREPKRRHPLMAARLAARAMQGEVQGDAEGVAAYRALEGLTFPRRDPGDPMDVERAEFEALKADLAPLVATSGAGGRGLPQWFGLPWYARVVGTIALNAHRVETMLPPSAWASGMAEDAAGSAVYGLASLFNHSCVPNVAHTAWAAPGDDALASPSVGPRLHFFATRPVRKGEELVIAYTDVEQGREARREHLRFNYGFECDCPKCTADHDDA